MATYHSSYLIIISAAILLFIHPALSDTTQELIDKVCRQMEDYGFCNQTFHQHLKSPSTDMTGLTQITVELSLELGTQTRNFIAYDLFPKAGNMGMRKILYDCETGYQTVMESFQKAAIAFFHKNYYSMFREEQIAPKALAGCNVEPPPPYPFNQLINLKKEMRILIAMALICAKDIAH